MKISVRWALITGFLGLIWGTHLITTTSAYLTSQEVLRRHARDIMQNIAGLAMEQSQRHLLHAHGAAALTRRLLMSNVVGRHSGQFEQLERYLYDQLSINPHFAGIYENMTLKLSSANVVLDAATTAAYGLQPGRYVSISVRDFGKGIAPQIIKRIFEPFFTTKKMGRGTGLGLASAFGIVKNHDGIIDVRSRVGHGTTFTIYLPARTTVAENSTHPPAAAPPSGSGTLLVVDDEAYILKALTGILKDLGYQVITAANGHQAIATFQECMRMIDGVLLDMVMPDMSGRQVLAALKAMRPDVRVILSSGYSLSGLGEDDPGKAADGFIQKPYRIEQLAAVLATALHRQDEPIDG